MIYGYIRVSTDKQTVENQRFEIRKYAKRKKIEIDGWVEETISGTISPDNAPVKSFQNLNMNFGQKKKNF